MPKSGVSTLLPPLTEVPPHFRAPPGPFHPSEVFKPHALSYGVRVCDEMSGIRTIESIDWAIGVCLRTL